MEKGIKKFDEKFEVKDDFIRFTIQILKAFAYF
jgi:hypothetical protein